MAKAVYRFPGTVVPVVNSGEAAIEPNDVVSLGSRIGVCGTRIPAGESGNVHVVGVFYLPKDSTAISQGDAVYFNESSGKITKTSTDIPAGWATEDAAAGDDSVSVKIG